MRNLLLTVMLLLVTGDAQQDNKPTNPVDTLTGVLTSVSLDENSHIARLSIESGKGRIPHEIRCTTDTRISRKGKAILVAKLKKGQTIDCTGTIKSGVLDATNCKVH